MKETFVYTVEIYEIMRNVNTAYLHHSSGLFLLLFIPTVYIKKSNVLFTLAIGEENIFRWHDICVHFIRIFFIKFYKEDVIEMKLNS